MLLGADLVKGQAVLEAAYDDAAGVTAAFDLNLLHRLNREAGADFDVPAFRHRAVWNPALERVRDASGGAAGQAVHLAGRTIRFAAGETIHTESSHKYRPERLSRLAAAAGWRAARIGPIRRRCSRSGCWSPEGRPRGPGAGARMILDVSWYSGRLRAYSACGQEIQEMDHAGRPRHLLA